MPRQLVMELHALEWVCVQYPRRFFASWKKWDIEEQCDCVKFSFKLGKTFTETFQMLKQAYGEDCSSRTQYHQWYQRYKWRRTSIEDDPKFRRSYTSMGDDRFEKVLSVIRQNYRLTVREVAKEVGICKCPCHLILTDKLKMRRVAAKFVPRLLTDALFIREFLTKHEATVVPQAPYSPVWPMRTFSCSRSWNPD